MLCSVDQSSRRNSPLWLKSDKMFRLGSWHDHVKVPTVVPTMQLSYTFAEALCKFTSWSCNRLSPTTIFILLPVAQQVGEMGDPNVYLDRSWHQYDIGMPVGKTKGMDIWPNVKVDLWSHSLIAGGPWKQIHFCNIVWLFSSDLMCNRTIYNLQRPLF